MIEPSTDLPQQVPVRRLSGATWAGLAFVAGTLFALLPMYYFYTGSTSAPREGIQPAPAAAAVETPASPAGVTSDRFAARMSYELSQVPEEPPARPVVADAAPAVAEPAVVAFRREPAENIEERPASRVANARPISSTPPDPRDTTREIENEARSAEYSRAPARAGSRGADSFQGRVAEGRDPVGTVKASIATRPIGMTTAPSTSRQPEQAEPVSRIPTAAVIAPERKGVDTLAKAGASVSGVSPIGAAPDASERSDASKKGVSAMDAPGAAGSDMESRLAATREWLSGAPQTMHTIQIMGTNSEEQLKGQLRALAKVLEPQKIYVFRTFAQGKPTMTVVYGGYPDRQAAQQALEKLPPSVSANRPVLRTVNGIRAELKQHGIKTES
jgi:septal ring-binding cell division protein DamX